MRGGAHEPLSAQALNAKFLENAAYGGWDESLAHTAQAWFDTAFDVASLEDVTEFRQ
jgi:hypothetical protein